MFRVYRKMMGFGHLFVLSVQFGHPSMYSEIPLLRPPKIKTSYLLKTLFARFKLLFSTFSMLSVPLIRDHLWECVQKWSLRPLLDCPKGGLNIGILLYLLHFSSDVMISF